MRKQTRSIGTCRKAQGREGQLGRGEALLGMTGRRGRDEAGKVTLGRSPKALTPAL